VKVTYEFQISKIGAGALKRNAQQLKGLEGVMGNPCVSIVGNQCLIRREVIVFENRNESGDSSTAIPICSALIRR
jgi:hypothetical protein